MNISSLRFPKFTSIINFSHLKLAAMIRRRKIIRGVFLPIKIMLITITGRQALLRIDLLKVYLFLLGFTRCLESAKNVVIVFLSVGTL